MSVGSLRYPQAVFVRIDDPAVEYLQLPFSHADAIYRPSERVVFTVVKQDARNLGNVWADLPWAYPEEVRLMAAIALSVPEACGMLRFAPLGGQKRLTLPFDVDLCSEEALASANEGAQAYADELLGHAVCSEVRDAEHSGSAFQELLFAAIDPSNALLIRSLYALLKSQHLAQHGNGVFFEEATMNVQIAREGVIELLRDYIREPGRRRPTEKDVFEYLRQNFRVGDALAAYLDDQRQRWVKTKHPRSDLGVFWAPPLEADDFVETYEALVSLFRHLLSGEPGRSSACFERE